MKSTPTRPEVERYQVSEMFSCWKLPISARMSDCSSQTIATAPTSGPRMVPLPPNTTASTIVIVR